LATIAPNVRQRFEKDLDERFRSQDAAHHDDECANLGPANRPLFDDAVAVALTAASVNVRCAAWTLILQKESMNG